MKKFKRIAALIVTTVTLAATTITACAADAYFNRGAIQAKYYLANNTIHYLNLKDGYNKNIFTFSNVDKTLMEGNVVLSVDFSDPTLSRKKITMSNIDIVDYMDGLYLMDTNGKFITEGKYPLTVSFNAPKGYVNVIVDTNWRVLNKFNLTRSYFTTNDQTKTDRLSLHYKVDDIHVLPSFNIILEEITSSSNPAKFTSEFIQNNMGYYTINARGDLATITQANVEFQIPSKYRGKDFYAYVNGTKVGKVTIPTKSTSSGSYVNY